MSASKVQNASPTDSLKSTHAIHYVINGCHQKGLYMNFKHNGKLLDRSSDHVSVNNTTVATVIDDARFLSKRYFSFLDFLVGYLRYYAIYKNTVRPESSECNQNEFDQNTFAHVLAIFNQNIPKSDSSLCAPTLFGSLRSKQIDAHNK